jgi:hypothetical protein
VIPQGAAAGTFRSNSLAKNRPYPIYSIDVNQEIKAVVNPVQRGVKPSKKLLTRQPTRYTFIEAIHKGQICECEIVLICRFPHHFELWLIL